MMDALKPTHLAPGVQRWFITQIPNENALVTSHRHDHIVDVRGKDCVEVGSHFCVSDTVPRRLSHPAVQHYGNHQQVELSANIDSFLEIGDKPSGIGFVGVFGTARFGLY